MVEIWQQALGWLQAHPEVAWGIGGLSLTLIVVSVALLPRLVSAIPAKYFQHPRHPTLGAAPRRGPVRWAKNILGIALILLGLAMIVLPGQGLLTMLVGLVLTDLPGKYRIERWVVTRPTLLPLIDALRGRRGAPALMLESEPLLVEKGSCAA